VEERRGAGGPVKQPHQDDDQYNGHQSKQNAKKTDLLLVERITALVALMGFAVGWGHFQIILDQHRR
jgi:hypothetical protein